LSLTKAPSAICDCMMHDASARLQDAQTYLYHDVFQKKHQSSADGSVERKQGEPVRLGLRAIGVTLETVQHRAARPMCTARYHHTDTMCVGVIHPTPRATLTFPPLNQALPLTSRLPSGPTESLEAAAAPRDTARDASTTRACAPMARCCCCVCGSRVPRDVFCTWSNNGPCQASVGHDDAF
jgi:hypothetical protein